MQYMTENRRIEEAYRSMNEYVDKTARRPSRFRGRGPYEPDDSEKYAEINDISRTTHLCQDIGYQLSGMLIEFLRNGMRRPSVDGIRIKVSADEHREYASQRPLDRKFVPHAQKAFEENQLNVAMEFAESVMRSGPEAFVTSSSRGTVLNPGLFTAHAEDGDLLFRAEIRIERPVRVNASVARPTSGRPTDRPFRKPSIPA